MAGDRTSKGQFAAGNRAAWRHGARSPRDRQANRERLLQAKRELVLGALPADPPAFALFYVDILVMAAADCDQLREYIDRMGGPISERGQLRKACEMLSVREGRVLQVLGDLQRLLGLGDLIRQRVLDAAGIGSPSALAVAAHARLRERVAAAESPEASNAHAVALSASRATGA